MRCWIASLALAVAASAAAEPAAYPGLEPFFASRMWRVCFGGTDPKEADEAARAIGEIAGLFRGEFPEGAAADFAKLTGPGLQEEVTLRLWHSYLPFVLLQLKPLWEKQAWSETDVALADAAAEFLAEGPDAPALHFAAGNDAGNRAQLVRLVDWFEGRVRDPLFYGRLIFTLDDGPWLPVDVDTSERFESLASTPVGDGRELHLCRVPESGTWCLQAVHAGALLWTRALDRVPDSPLRLAKDPPTPLGAYGWKVHMSFGEYVHLYLGPDYEPLFYYTSW